VREWQGLREDISDVAEDGLATATNLSYAIDGEIRRRPGFADRVDEAGTLVTEWTDPFGSGYLVYNTGAGSLKTVKVSDTTETTIASSLNTANRGCYAKSNGRLYFVNDFDAMVRIERGDQTAGTVGIAAPTGTIGAPTFATTGVVTVGIHGLRYRYFDSKSLYVSDPSGQYDLTLAGAATLTFSIGTGTENILRSQDTKVDQVIIEMTDAGSSTFYRAATVNQTLTGTTVNLADTDLRTQTTAARDGDFGHQQAPLCSMIQEHRARVFGWGSTVYTITGITAGTGSTISVTGSTMSSNWAGRLIRLGSDTKGYRITTMSGTALAVLSEAYTGTAGVKTGAVIYSATPDMLYWSRAGFPESWHPTSFARRVLQNQSDTPAGMASYNDTLWLFGQRTIRALDYAADPATGSLITIPTEMGLWNKRCLVEADGKLFGWGRSGAWVIRGLMPVHISKPIDGAIDGTDASSSHTFDISDREAFHGVYDPRERVISWFYMTSSEDYPQHAIAYDLDSENWSIRTFKQGIRASTLTTGGDNSLTRALLADHNGYSWYLTLDRFDGVPTAMSGGVVTVTTGNATTFSVSESLPTGTGGLQGIMATTTGGVSRVIASNTASAITLSSAFSSAPSAGAEIFLGQIDFAIRTKWVVADSLDAKKRPAYCAVRMVPGATSTSKAVVTIYLDYATSAYTYTKGSGDTDPDGVSITNGSSNVTIDLDGGSGDGVVFVPLPAEWHRAIAVQITSTRPKDLLKILDIDFIYKDGRSIRKVENE
jgi:hypothetical protein